MPLRTSKLRSALSEAGDRLKKSVHKFFQKVLICLKERRIPSKLRAQKFFYVCSLKLGLFLDQRTHRKPAQVPLSGKNLYASPVGIHGKMYLEKIIKRFGFDHFDYVIFAYDDTSFDEKIFEKCRIIREKGAKWFFMKKYLTPEFCRKYDYIFTWDDDIDIGNFSCENFIRILRANALELAQPALVGGNQTHKITNRVEGKTGRLVDFVEIMTPVFTREAWRRWWYMMETDENAWGFGYDDLARSFCGYKRMGIVDREHVQHMRELECVKNVQADIFRMAAAEKFIRKNQGLIRAFRVSYGSISLPD